MDYTCMQIYSQVSQNGRGVVDNVILCQGDGRPVDMFVPLTIAILTAFSLTLALGASVVAEDFKSTTRSSMRAEAEAEW